MTAAPVVRWAIKYVHKETPDWIDLGTISGTRAVAWEKFEADYEVHVQPFCDEPGEAKRMRRKREVVAVRVEIREKQ